VTKRVNAAPRRQEIIYSTSQRLSTKHIGEFRSSGGIRPMRAAAHWQLEFQLKNQGHRLRAVEKKTVKRGKNFKRLFDCDGEFFVFLLAQQPFYLKLTVVLNFYRTFCFAVKDVGHWINELFLFINSISKQALAAPLIFYVHINRAAILLKVDVKIDISIQQRDTWKFKFCTQTTFTWRQLNKLSMTSFVWCYTTSASARQLEIVQAGENAK